MSVNPTGRKELAMNKEKEPLFIGVDTVMFDLGVSRAKAYDVIRELNEELKKEHTTAGNGKFPATTPTGPANVKDTLRGASIQGKRHLNTSISS